MLLCGWMAETRGQGFGIEAFLSRASRERSHSSLPLCCVFLSIDGTERQLARNKGWRGLQQVKNGEHRRECRGLQGVGSTARVQDCWWQLGAGEKHMSSSVSKVW